jgi:hypothetical protein
MLKSTETLITTSNETGLNVNAEKTRFIVMSEEQNVERKENIKTGNKSLEMVEQFIYLRTTLTNQNSSHEEFKCRSKSRNACCHSV